MSKGYPTHTGELRNKLLVAMEQLHAKRMDTDTAKEMVRLANSINESVRTEFSIWKTEQMLGKTMDSLGNLKLNMGDDSNSSPPKTEA